MPKSLYCAVYHINVAYATKRQWEYLGISNWGYICSFFFFLGRAFLWKTSLNALQNEIVIQYNSLNDKSGESRGQKTMDKKDDLRNLRD
jgi:hypothetical protein